MCLLPNGVNGARQRSNQPDRLALSSPLDRTENYRGRMDCDAQSRNQEARRKQEGRGNKMKCIPEQDLHTEECIKGMAPCDGFRCSVCGVMLSGDLQSSPNPTMCHECADGYAGAAYREMDAVRSSVNYSEPLIHAWNEPTTGALCSGKQELNITVWRSKEINCPGCLSLMSAINRQEAERGNTTVEDYDEYIGLQRLEDASFALADSLQGCRESDRLAEGLDAMGKPTYGKNAIQHCYMCHAWCRGDIFIVTAVDINGKELCWKSTKDLAEVGSIVREFSGV